ncbi:MAG: hypothetical protein R6V76_04695 [Desulfobacterales bacterium]
MIIRKGSRGQGFQWKTFFYILMIQSKNKTRKTNDSFDRINRIYMIIRPLRGV